MDVGAKVACGMASSLGVGGGCFMTYDWQIKPNNVGEFLRWQGKEPLNTDIFEEIEKDPDWYYWYAVVKRHLVKQKAETPVVHGEADSQPPTQKKTSPKDDVVAVPRLSELTLEDIDSDEDKSKLKQNIETFKSTCSGFLNTSLEIVYEQLSSEEDSSNTDNTLVKANNWCTRESLAAKWFVSSVDPETLKPKVPDSKAAAAEAKDT